MNGGDGGLQARKKVMGIKPARNHRGCSNTELQRHKAQVHAVRNSAARADEKQCVFEDRWAHNQNAAKSQKIFIHSFFSTSECSRSSVY